MEVHSEGKSNKEARGRNRCNENKRASARYYKLDSGGPAKISFSERGRDCK